MSEGLNTVRTVWLRRPASALPPARSSFYAAAMFDYGDQTLLTFSLNLLIAPCQVRIFRDYSRLQNITENYRNFLCSCLPVRRSRTRRFSKMPRF